MVVLETDKVYVYRLLYRKQRPVWSLPLNPHPSAALLTEMVGMDANGAITGVKVTAHAIHQGLGTKAHEAASILEQYVGLDRLAVQLTT